MIGKRTAGGLCLLLGLGAFSSAEAVVFGPGTPEGFVAGLTGASTFGLPDGQPGSITCPLCDSTVNFTVYSNADGPAGDQWFDDIGLAPTFLQGVDITARWIFMYQIQNTDPLTAGEGELENFNVTSTDTTGGPVPTNPYSSGGFFNATDITPFTVPALDVPNDQTPSQIAAKSVGPGADDINPTGLLFTNAAGPNPIASAAINAGGTPYAGALFAFANPLIGLNSFSDVLFLTSNSPTVGFVWGETESPGGFGAAGDVPGVVSGVVPLPASLVFLLTALGGLGYLGRRKEAV